MRKGAIVPWLFANILVVIAMTLVATAGYGTAFLTAVDISSPLVIMLVVVAEALLFLAT